MGTFSIWHWLIVIAVVMLVGLVPILAASSKKTLARKAYALRTISAYGAMLLIGFLAGATEGEAASSLLASGVGLLMNLTLAILALVWSVHRVQDIGWAKWWCLLLFVPLVGLIFWLVLLFKPGSHTDVAEVFA